MRSPARTCRKSSASRAAGVLDRGCGEFWTHGGPTQRPREKNDQRPGSAGSRRGRVTGADGGIAQEVSMPMNRIRFRPGMSPREFQTRCGAGRQCRRPRPGRARQPSGCTAIRASATARPVTPSLLASCAFQHPDTEAAARTAMPAGLGSSSGNLERPPEPRFEVSRAHAPCAAVPVDTARSCATEQTTRSGTRTLDRRRTLP